MSAAGEPHGLGRLAGARVLVELGEPYDAERQVAQLLENAPADSDALCLMAKIKHLSGDLVQLVACWAQLYTLRPQADSTLAQLKALDALVRDPLGAAADFVAASRFRSVHTTTVWLELADVLSELAQGNPEVARYKALRAQAQHRYPPDARKLTTLAAAWVCERTGQRAQALQLLEMLGAENGFETDFDRVRMLARIYEADGDPDHLESAFHIWKFIERRSDHLETHSRLTSLCRKRAGVERTRAQEHEHHLVFHRHMQRPVLDEVLEVASTHYLPLFQLAQLSPPGEQGPSPSPRAQAVALAIAGDRRSARERLKAGGTLLDQKYLADLCVLEGDLEQAASHYLSVLHDDPHDLRLIEWLLDHRELVAKGDDERAFCGPLAEPMSEALDEALRSAPLRPSLWRYRAMVSRLAERSSAAQHDERRAALLEEQGARPRATRAVLTPAVFRVLGRARGVIAQVVVSRVSAPGADGALEPAGLSELEPRLRRSVPRLFSAVRDHLTRTQGGPPDDRGFRYRLELSGVHAQAAGASCELPVALAFLAAMLQLEPVPRLAVGGGLRVEHGTVGALEAAADSELAVKAAYHRNLTCLVLPEANRASLAANVRIPGEIERQLVRYAARFEDVVALAFRGQRPAPVRLAPRPFGGAAPPAPPP